MKISANHPLARYMLITDNDKIVKNVIQLDTEEGYYDVYGVDKNDKLLVNNKQATVHRIFSNKIHCNIDFEIVVKHKDYVVDSIDFTHSNL